MSGKYDDERRRLLSNLQSCAAAGQIDRRGFFELATLIGIGSAVAESFVDQVKAAPEVLARIGRSYDYVVIGAGSAGCALAARLTEDATCRVLVVEAGGDDVSRPALQNPVLWPSNFGTDVDWAYQTTAQLRAGGRTIDWPRGKIIGGSSTINAMIWVWGHAADFDQWANAGCDGWDYASLKPFFQSVETCARKHPTSDRGARGPMFVEPLAEPSSLTAGFFEACGGLGHRVADDVSAPIRDGAGYVDFNTKDGRRFSVVHGYLLPALERGNLTLLTGARAVALLFEGSRCTGVKLRIGAEEHEVIAERETILCAGVVESPRLLMLSGVGRAEELRRHDIRVVSNLPGVGENLQDHCFITGFIGETKSPMAPGSRAGCHLFFRTTKGAFGPDIQALLATSAVGTTEIKPNEGFSIRVALVRPQSRGRITITSADPNAPLLINPNYLAAASDLSRLGEAVEHSRAIGSAAGLSPWRKREIRAIPAGSSELKEFVARNVGSYWHPVGTCAMGVHEEAVVDPLLHVYGTTKLRVADASIMPNITSGNTNAPTIVIAERAAKMIMDARKEAHPSSRSLLTSANRLS